LRLLLVEDEPFIALDLEILVQAAGHQIVGIAESFDEALAKAASDQPDAALVDINLRDGMTGLQVARALAQGLGVPVAFVTGNAEQVPPDFAGAMALIEKPFSPEAVSEVLAILGAAHEGRSPPPPRYARTAR